jgi:hypothetical protein
MNTEREQRIKNLRDNLSNFSLTLEQVVLKQAQPSKNEPPLLRNASYKQLGKMKRKPSFEPLALVRQNIQNYNSGMHTYNIKKINEIIYEEWKHIVSVFRDNIIWYDENEYFLK